MADVERRWKGILREGRILKSGESRVLRCDERSNMITHKKSKKTLKKRKMKEKNSNDVEMFPTLQKTVGCNNKHRITNEENAVDIMTI